MKTYSATVPVVASEMIAKTKLHKYPCGCQPVQCDCCSNMVPAGEILFLPADSNSSGSDTYACCVCRRTDAEDYHPTCRTCGSCAECSCEVQ